MVGYICRTINIEATTKSVRPDRKKNISQNSGITKSVWPLLLSMYGGMATIKLNHIKKRID